MADGNVDLRCFITLGFPLSKRRFTMDRNAMHYQAIRAKLAEFIGKNFLVEFGEEATDSTDLFEGGFIDSFGFVELVAFIEKEFAIALDDDDLASEEMATLVGMTELIANRTGVT